MQPNLKRIKVINNVLWVEIFMWLTERVKPLNNSKLALKVNPTFFRDTLYILKYSPLGTWLDHVTTWLLNVASSQWRTTSKPPSLSPPASSCCSPTSWQEVPSSPPGRTGPSWTELTSALSVWWQSGLETSCLVIITSTTSTRTSAPVRPMLRKEFKNTKKTNYI